MVVTTLICIISCIFIICLFTFFTIVYLCELKREKELRKLIREETDKYLSMDNLPIVLMDLPVKAISNTAEPTVQTKPKKNIN